MSNPGFQPAGGLGLNFAPPGSIASDRQAPWQQGKLFFGNFGGSADGWPIRVKGPALIDFQGFGVNGGSYTPGALHNMRFFVVPQPSNTPNVFPNLRVRVPLVNQGPYLFIPQGGDYSLFVDSVVDSNITGLPNPDTAGWFFIITENYTAEMASLVMVQPPRVQRAIGVLHTIPGASNAHLLPPSPSSNFGQQQDGHVCGIVIQSNNAASLRNKYLAFGRNAAVTDFELAPLSISQGLNEYKLGCGDSVNVFNGAAGAETVSVIWYFQ